MKLAETTMTRFRSLKEKFTDRYFTARDCLDFLKIEKGKDYQCYDLLAALLKFNLISKIHPPKKPIQYKIGGIMETPRPAEAPAVNIKAAVAKLIKPELPTILDINGVKYVRMDKIAEVIMDGL